MLILAGWLFSVLHVLPSVPLTQPPSTVNCPEECRRLWVCVLFKRQRLSRIQLVFTAIKKNQFDCVWWQVIVISFEFKSRPNNIFSASEFFFYTPRQSVAVNISLWIEMIVQSDKMMREQSVNNNNNNNSWVAVSPPAAVAAPDHFSLFLYLFTHIYREKLQKFNFKKIYHISSLHSEITISQSLFF
jgi:hypothetical protein